MLAVALLANAIQELAELNELAVPHREPLAVLKACLGHFADELDARGKLRQLTLVCVLVSLRVSALACVAIEDHARRFIVFETGRAASSDPTRCSPPGLVTYEVKPRGYTFRLQVSAATGLPAVFTRMLLSAVTAAQIWTPTWLF